MSVPGGQTYLQRHPGDQLQCLRSGGGPTIASGCPFHRMLCSVSLLQRMTLPVAARSRSARSLVDARLRGLGSARFAFLDIVRSAYDDSARCDRNGWPGRIGFSAAALFSFGWPKPGARRWHHGRAPVGVSGTVMLGDSQLLLSRSLSSIPPLSISPFAPAWS